MSGCLDRVSCDCDCVESLKEWFKPKRNMLSSIIAGTLFSLGWWLVIDAMVEHSEPMYGAYILCGIASTVALLMINSVSTGQVTGDEYNEGCIGQRGARVWLFLGFVLAFGGLLGSLWVFIQQFIVANVVHNCSIIASPNSTNSSSYNATSTNATTTSTPTVCAPIPAYWWQGVAFFLQNILIFSSALLCKFGRTEEETW